MIHPLQDISPTESFDVGSAWNQVRYEDTQAIHDFTSVMHGEIWTLGITEDYSYSGVLDNPKLPVPLIKELDFTLPS